MSDILAEVRSLDSKYMNATLPCGVAFRGGVALVDDPRRLLEVLRTPGVQVTPREAHIERVAGWINDLGPFKTLQAEITLPDGYRLRRIKRVGAGVEMVYHGKTLEQRYPTEDPEPEPVPAVEEAINEVLGWTPPEDGA